MTAQRLAILGLMTMALTYAAVAGLRTVSDPDLGWQLAAGRYLVERGAIPSHDVFSHTAAGREWIYPPFSGAFLYLTYSLGGWEALSWLAAAASLATVAILLSGGGASSTRAVTVLLVVFAAPYVAARTKARAELFSTFLFAAVLVLLWRHYRGRRAPLWPLPPIMLAWANLHLGFLAGLALFGCYGAMEAVQLLSPNNRTAAVARVRRAAPWLAAGLCATLINPWGPRLYLAIFRQNRILESFHAATIGEWLPGQLSWFPHYPESGFAWLLLAGVAASAIAVWQRSPAPMLLLAGTLIAGMRHVRFEVLFAMTAAVVAGDVIGTTAGRTRFASDKPRTAVFAMVLLAAVGAFTAARIADLVSNNYYLRIGENVTFGQGRSWWYPERAASFIVREKLPAQVLNDYNSGGYLSFALWPQYQVSIDNRAVPFGADVFFLHQRLTGGPNAPEWRTAFGRWSINTLILSTFRYGGLSTHLRDFCASPGWRAVYLDEVSAVFVRARPENARLIERLALDCARVEFRPPVTRNRAVLYNFYANAGWVLFALGRPAESLAALERARSLFGADAHLALMHGAILQASGRFADAEREYRRSLSLYESDEVWHAVGHVAALQGRYADASQALERAAVLSQSPHEIYHALAEVRLELKQPAKAIEAFDAAEVSPDLTIAVRAGLDYGRARAWRDLGNLPRAIKFQERAVRSRPEQRQWWLQLAEMYESQGRIDQAQEARARAGTAARSAAAVNHSP